MNIKERIKSQNQSNLLKGVLLFGLSIPCWIFSYWLIRLLIFIPCYLWKAGPDWNETRYAALAGILLLLVEGVRYGKPLFDLDEFTKSFYYQGFTGTDEEYLLLSSAVGITPREVY